MNHNNCKIYSINELKKINEQQIEFIKKYALITYEKFMQKNKKNKNFSYQVINTNSSSKKAPNRKFLPDSANYYSPYTLEDNLIYKTSTVSCPLVKDNEKMLFICICLFNNDEYFLNILSEHNYLKILNELIQNYNYFDEKYHYKTELCDFQKKIFFNKFIRQYNDELMELQKYFYDYHKITNLYFIINKLFQINYFNNELYEQYIQTNINTLIKK